MAKCLAFINRYQYNITSPYGERNHPITGEKGKFHDGEDVTPIGAPDINNVKVSPVASGIVEAVKTDVKGYSEAKGETGGNYVAIRHTDGKITGYKHLKYGSIPDCIKLGTKVYTNTCIGVMGTTGLSTGIHLHFEVILNGKTQYPDPHINGIIKIPGWDETGEVEEMGYPILGEKEYVNATEHPKDRVTKLQQILVHKYGYDLQIDGVWTDKLEKAIKDYQAQNGLGIDGRVGPATIASLNRDLYAEIKGLRSEKMALVETVAQSEAEVKKATESLIKAQQECGKLATERDTAKAKLDGIKSAVEIIKSI